MPGVEEIPPPKWILLEAYVVVPDNGSLILGDREYYPGAATKCFEDWGISWVGTSVPSRTRDVLKLTSERIRAVQIWHDGAFQKGIEWPNIFWTTNDAETFRNMFFPDLPEATVLTVSCDEADCDDLLDETRPGAYETGESGLFKAASTRRAAEEAAEDAYVGYEVLGLEAGGRFESLNAFEFWNRPEAAVLGTRPNKHGHLTTWTEAKEVEKLANTIDGGLDGIPWFAVRITADLRPRL